MVAGRTTWSLLGVSDDLSQLMTIDPEDSASGWASHSDWIGDSTQDYYAPRDTTKGRLATIVFANNTAGEMAFRVVGPWTGLVGRTGSLGATSWRNSFVAAYVSPLYFDC